MIENIRAYIKLVYPDEMTLHAKRMLENILEVHEGWVAPDLVSRVAQWFHEEYERLAPTIGYETRPETAVPWAEIPAKNRMLMLETVSAVLDRLVDAGIELPMIDPM